jgi:carboxylesterase type B
MNIKLLILIPTVIALCIGACACSASEQQRKNTTSFSIPPLETTLNDSIKHKSSFGELKGRTDGEISTFQGIPYALAPIANNRWKTSQIHPPIDGILDATDFGFSCVQHMRQGYFADPRPVSEDCLTLNIWASNDTETKKPVIVWIH